MGRQPESPRERDERERERGQRVGGRYRKLSAGYEPTQLPWTSIVRRRSDVRTSTLTTDSCDHPPFARPLAASVLPLSPGGRETKQDSDSSPPFTSIVELQRTSTTARANIDRIGPAQTDNSSVKSIIHTAECAVLVSTSLSTPLQRHRDRLPIDRCCIYAKCGNSRALATLVDGHCKMALEREGGVQLNMKSWLMILLQNVDINIMFAHFRLKDCGRYAVGSLLADISENADGPRKQSCSENDNFVQIICICIVCRQIF